MCKFHKVVARDAATNPETGVFDPGRYCVMLGVMTTFRMEQYMPSMYTLNGFKPEEMTTPEAIESFESSGLKRPIAEIEAETAALLPIIRQALDTVARSMDISMTALNNPDTLTKDGYKHCAKMAPDFTRTGPFMEEAVVELVTGYDDGDKKTYASQRLRIVDVAHKPQYEPLRAAAAFLLEQSGVDAALKRLFEGSVAKIFITAAEDAAAGRGLENDGCVMCGHGSRRNAPGM